MCRASSVGRSCGKIRLTGKVFRERTHADDVKLEERDDLLLYVEERGPRKGSQQSNDEIFQVPMVSQAGPSIEASEARTFSFLSRLCLFRLHKFVYRNQPCSQFWHSPCLLKRINIPTGQKFVPRPSY